MKNRKIGWGTLAIVAVVAMIGFSMMGCMTVDPLPSRLPAVSDYTFIPSKDYVVVGAVVVRDASHQTLVADLMDKAIAMGGHDIMNIRVDWHQTPMGSNEISTATAVVIQYTEETLVEETTTTVITADGVTQTTTDRRYVGNSGGGNSTVSSSATGESTGSTEKRGLFARGR